MSSACMLPSSGTYSRAVGIGELNFACFVLNVSPRDNGITFGLITYELETCTVASQ